MFTPQLMPTVLLTSFISLFGLTTSLYANIKAEGCFVAKHNCEALHAIKKRTNSEKIRLTPFELYSVSAQNKNPPTHYQITIQSSRQLRRWVPLSCGNYVQNCRLLPNTSMPFSAKKAYLLALSWEPTFCETHPQNAECKTLTSDRKDAKQLSLHGLWPQPKSNAYCHVDSTVKAIDRRKKWGLLKPLVLTQKTRNKLSIVMPGYASNLQRHEWIKHGTCYGTSAEQYYTDSIRLTELINQSKVGELFRSNIGKRITAKSVRKAFDHSFGSGAGDKVNMRCDKKGRLSELWINLAGSISSTSLNQLLLDANNASNNCQTGLVDPV